MTVEEIKAEIQNLVPVQDNDKHNNAVLRLSNYFDEALESKLVEVKEEAEKNIYLQFVEAMRGGIENSIPPKNLVDEVELEGCIHAIRILAIICNRQDKAESSSLNNKTNE